MSILHIFTFYILIFFKLDAFKIKEECVFNADADDDENLFFSILHIIL